MNSTGNKKGANDTQICPNINSISKCAMPLEEFHSSLSVRIFTQRFGYKYLLIIPFLWLLTWYATASLPVFAMSSVPAKPMCVASHLKYTLSSHLLTSLSFHCLFTK